MLARKGIIQFDNIDAIIIGNDLKVGQQAPSFKAQLQNWSFLDILKMTQGKVRIIASIPSLETSVSNLETRRFNEEAVSLSKEISIIVISMDLPYTQAKWCADAGISRVLVVSDHLKASFGKKYACLLKDQRVLRSAVFVIDKAYKVRYVDYMKGLGYEPDYPSVLEAAIRCL